MRVEATSLDGPLVIVQQRHTDQRGYFRRIFCEDSLRDDGVLVHCSQINMSASETASTLRGLHFQYPPHSEAKVITCVRGAIFDVAVDLRPSSATFLQSVGVHLNAEDDRSFYVPEGFAHGFVTLEASTHVVYASSSPYEPSSEDGIHFGDPLLKINWPRLPTVVSPKDASWPSLQPRLQQVVERIQAGEGR